MWLLGQAIAVVSMIGFIALPGVTAEFGVFMMLYLRNACDREVAMNPHVEEAALNAAIREGSLQRVRPKAMTVAVIMAGLLPILLGSVPVPR